MIIVISIVGLLVGIGFLGISGGMNWMPGYIIGGIIAGVSVLVLIIGSIAKGGLTKGNKYSTKNDDEKQVTVKINGESYSGTVKKDK